MKGIFAGLSLGVLVMLAYANQPKELLLTGLVCLPDGRLLVSAHGTATSPAGIYLSKNNALQPFSPGMKAPMGLAVFQQWLLVADGDCVRRVNLNDGKSEVWAESSAFPGSPQQLRAITVDEAGVVYVADAMAKAIYRIVAKGTPKKPQTVREVSVLIDAQRAAFLQQPTALALDSRNHLLILDAQTGELTRLRMPDLSAEKVADGFRDGSALLWDRFGRLYVAYANSLAAIPRPGVKPVLVHQSKSPLVSIALDRSNSQLHLLSRNAEQPLSQIPAVIPGWEVDQSSLPVKTEVVFGDLQWTNWDLGLESGKVNPLRPIVLTHAGDGSGRIFVATQHGQVHTFPESATNQATRVFLDIQSRCFYSDKENEQGLLGLAFHPKYKDNGEFFVFYTDKRTKLQNVLSRFRVSKDDPNKADPNSEQELLRVSHRFWNHDGGTICFGPDGYLYLVLGDGGSANDPDDNGQKMDTLLGKILRINIDSQGDGTLYGIPKDNPFVGKPGVRPEIYAVGVRNPWRMSFDRKTGQGWFGEVGQNLWEEINLLHKGANYGWRRREGLHPFGADGTAERPEFTEPIWEYYHDIGKSITGGHVYRGSRVPELEGLYLYADYVSGRIWALKYDDKLKRVTANRAIQDKSLPILSFGEDEKGEVYLLTFSASGEGIHRFVRTAK